MSNILVLGLGKAGAAAARYAAATGNNVTVYAGASSEKAIATAKPLQDVGVCVVFDTEDVQGSYDLCVASPGISENSPFYQAGKAASHELVGECEYAFRLSPENWLAVTGTNGKTTTTSLLAHLLNAAGKKAFPCGNIGDTCTDAVAHRREGETLVAEMSSYGLASTSKFAPQCAILLNITPDHLSWHGSLEAYAQAKMKVFANMGEGSTAVICDEVPQSARIAEDLRSRGIRVVTVGSSKGADCAYQDAQGMLRVRIDGSEVELCSIDELMIKGPHNVMNALSAAACALAYGCDVDGVIAGLKDFAPLEHRIEPCGEVRGVGYFNDSKATNVDATLVALKAFPKHSIVLLLGGRDKGTDLAPLVEASKGVVRTVICYGEAGPRMHEAYKDFDGELLSAQGMRDAFALAADIAEEGDVVLLSPACASFDEFNSFNHRGDVFKELIAQLQE